MESNASFLTMVLLLSFAAASMGFQAGGFGCGGGMPKIPVSISVGNHGVGVAGKHGGIHAGIGRNHKTVGGHVNLPSGHQVHGQHVKQHIPGAGNIHHTNVGVNGPVGGGTFSVEASKTSGMGMPVQKAIGAAFEKTAKNGVSYKIEAGRDPQNGNYGKATINIPLP